MKSHPTFWIQSCKKHHWCGFNSLSFTFGCALASKEHTEVPTRRTLLLKLHKWICLRGRESRTLALSWLHGTEPHDENNISRQRKIILPYRNKLSMERVVITCPQTWGVGWGKACSQHTVCYIQVMRIGSLMFGALLQGWHLFPHSNGPVSSKKLFFLRFQRSFFL